MHMAIIIIILHFYTVMGKSLAHFFSIFLAAPPEGWEHFTCFRTWSNNRLSTKMTYIIQGPYKKIIEKNVPDFYPWLFTFTSSSLRCEKISLYDQIRKQIKYANKYVSPYISVKFHLVKCTISVTHHAHPSNIPDQSRRSPEPYFHATNSYWVYDIPWPLSGYE